MEANIQRYADQLVERYPALLVVKEAVTSAYTLLEYRFSKGGKLLVAGNGGSAADAEHIVGELMKGFKKKRCVSQAFQEQLKAVDPVRGEQLGRDLQGALPALALTNHTALNSAFLNDVNGLESFAQQVYGYGSMDDVFLAISTSGNSKNILYATAVARAKGIPVIGLTGADGGELAKIADVAICVPETETYMVQELHLPVYHCLCLMLEEHFFGG